MVLTIPKLIDLPKPRSRLLQFKNLSPDWWRAEKNGIKESFPVRLVEFLGATNRNNIHRILDFFCKAIAFVLTKKVCQWP